MGLPRIHPLLSGSVLAVALTALYLAFVGPPTPRPDPIQSDLGRALAREALRVAGPRPRVTLLLRDTSQFPQPAAVAVADATEKELLRGGAELGPRQEYAVDALRPLQVPPGDFFELLRRAKSNEVFISLLGPPLLTEEQRSALGRPQARVVAFCPGEMAENLNLPALAEAGLLHGLVQARPTLRTHSSGPRLPETFDRLYVVGLPAGTPQP